MIVLFTDFGIDSPYVGQMKLAIQRHAPTRPIIDLLHCAPAFDYQASAYLLAALTRDITTDCAVVAVVDPGVGSARDGIFICADQCWYVGPANGLFDRVVAEAKSVQSWRIDWQPTHASASFHGRDIFAPVAAMLLSGKQAHELGTRIEYQLQMWPHQLSRVIYIDPYGNAMTGIQAATVPETAYVQISEHKLNHARTFSDVLIGQGFWYENSSGLLEIAVNQGRADIQLEISLGTPVELLEQ